VLKWGWSGVGLGLDWDWSGVELFNRVARKGKEKAKKRQRNECTYHDDAHVLLVLVGLQVLHHVGVRAKRLS
jgi:hypothetical protein